MKSYILLSLAAGVAIGALATFFIMRDTDEPGRAVVAEKNDPKFRNKVEVDGSIDPFAEHEKLHASENATDHHLKKRDMGDPMQRDICISIWYLSMQKVVRELEILTGHEFKPVAKVSAGPVEILEEQAAFMKDFLAETERLHNSN